MIVSGIVRLGKAPKMSYTAKGTAQTFFSGAFDTGWGDNKKTIWVNVGCWGQLAETVNKFLQKGSRVSIVAEITDLGTYTKDNGDVSPTLSVKLMKVDFIDNIAKQENETPYDEIVEYEPEEF